MEKIATVIKPKWKLIAAAAIVAALAAGAVSFVQPLSYSASVGLLITQKESFTLDPYTALRSSELVGENLAQLIVTSSFLERVLETGYNIDRSYFDVAEQRRRRLWQKTIAANQKRGTGILRIVAYHPDRGEALKIAAASAFLLSTQGGDYVGRDLTVRLIEAPLASRFPVRPNLVARAILGLIAGAAAASLWVWVDHRNKKHHGNII